ncbi:MAG: FAD-binding oxidoreductase [Gammaproteobacteria bacterium]|jgi:FAD/FMN-containing dehydrogenase|nr:FAD-binding oxidoreductase [Gammaproteobacteria bacterium]MBT5542752.1 FAD-binding oxidoreductase [Gammaproteobacteria bacterium]MBT6074489.1 FAD-binding oxidoreductase [Gammaproteobacteria bacterium]MBT7753695.1 FAD-binding oxidoreductase [Gammaproteobacteria bacterium]MDG2435056.1 FAD-binding oxidoreductase [Gammaproteobacteria bacterium]
MDTNEIDLIKVLKAAIGEKYVLTDEHSLEFYSTDVYRSLEIPLAIIQPGNIGELQESVRIAAGLGISIVTRGGGASYTDAYLPTDPNSIIIDTSRLNKILEINEEDMFVTVEPGVTWAEMSAALAEKKLRTPFWGPFSGLKATVGGSTSQNSVSMGTSAYGGSPESVLCYEVVLASGKMIKTGSLAMENSTPFFRNYGPDITGIFSGDAGALGVKASITLRLIKLPSHTLTCSFGFKTYDSMSQAMAAVAREESASSNWGLDPKLQQGQLGKVTFMDSIKAAYEVLKTARNPLEAIVQLMKMALAGKRFLTGFDYSSHFVVEGHSTAEVKSKLAQTRKAANSFGTEIANTIPTVMGAMPFMPLYPILGPNGERWVPMHGLLPFSKMQKMYNRIQDLYLEKKEAMTKHSVEAGTMFMTYSTHSFLYEVALYWKDDRSIYHKTYLDQDYLDMLPIHDANPEGRALIAELKTRVQEIYSDLGAVHFQVGKSYPYQNGRQAEAAMALQDIKKSLDPNNIMNPGALGL